MKKERRDDSIQRVPADVELTEVGTTIDDVIVVGVLEEDVDSRVLDARSARLREGGGEWERGCRSLPCDSPSR